MAGGRPHTESDPRCYLSWCAERGLDPLAPRRPYLELYIQWMPASEPSFSPTRHLGLLRGAQVFKVLIG